MKDLILTLLSIIIVCGIVYGVYQIGKTFSYSFFYEDMVERTISKQVKPSCLKERS